MPMFGGGGGSGDWILLQAINLDAGAAASFDFTSITAYEAYHLIFQGSSANDAKTLGIRFNNDSGNNYYSQTLSQADTTLAGSKTAASAYGLLGGTTNSGADGTSILTADILNGRADKVKSWQARFSRREAIQHLTAGVWNNQADLISRITVILTDGSNFAQYSDCKLYGVK